MKKDNKMAIMSVAAVAIAAALNSILYAYIALEDAGVGVHYHQSVCRTRSNWVGHGKGR